jgi:hypothetical protein
MAFKFWLMVVRRCRVNVAEKHSFHSFCQWHLWTFAVCACVCVCVLCVLCVLFDGFEMNSLVMVHS